MGLWRSSVNALGWGVNKALHVLGYDALESSSKRAAIAFEDGTEDQVLRPLQSRILHSGIRNLYRNTAILPWMIRRHLDFVSGFDFNCTHKNADFRERLEKWVERRGQAKHCDATQRFSRYELMRFTEALRTLEGELLHIHRKDDRWQLVRRNRLREPELPGRLNWIGGVGVDADGVPRSYAVWKQITQGDWFAGYEFEAQIPASVARLHGYFELGPDQYHGVSPLACGFNDLVDVYGAKVLALARMKLGQLLAAVIYENSNPIPGRVDAPGEAKVDPQSKQVTVDFGKGPQILRQKVGDKVEFLNPQVPNSDFIAFNEAVMMLCLKCLDLPYSFAREDFTNWVGQQSAMQIYKASCRHRRKQNRDLLMWHLELDLRNAVLHGEIELPPGDTIESVLDTCDWTAIGLPWWNPAKQIEGDVAAIRAGIANPFQVCTENNTDFEENLKAIKRAKELAAELEIDLDWSPQAAPKDATRKRRKRAALKAKSEVTQ